MPRRLPPGCVEDRDRHGNVRIYYRRKGFRKVRLQGTPWTPEFMAAYDAAKKIAAPPQGVIARPTLPNTWSWLCLSYFEESPNTNTWTLARNVFVGLSLKAHSTN